MYYLWFFDVGAKAVGREDLSSTTTKIAHQIVKKCRHNVTVRQPRTRRHNQAERSKWVVAQAQHTEK